MSRKSALLAHLRTHPPTQLGETWFPRGSLASFQQHTVARTSECTWCSTHAMDQLLVSRTPWCTAEGIHARNESRTGTAVALKRESSHVRCIPLGTSRFRCCNIHAESSRTSKYECCMHTQTSRGCNSTRPQHTFRYHCIADHGPGSVQRNHHHPIRYRKRTHLRSTFRD